jgi:hypothetical protein
MKTVYIIFKKHPNINDTIELVTDNKEVAEQYSNKKNYYIEEHEVIS